MSEEQDKTNDNIPEMSQDKSNDLMPDTESLKDSVIESPGKDEPVEVESKKVYEVPEEQAIKQIDPIDEKPVVNEPEEEVLDKVKDIETSEVDPDLEAREEKASKDPG